MQWNSSAAARATLAMLRPWSPRRIRSAAVKLSLSSRARAVAKAGLTYLSPQRLRVLERSVRDVDRRGIPGDFVECGVALGGSAILLSTLLAPQRRFHGYDVFEMIPAPGAEDERDAHDRYAVIKAGASRGIGGEQYYGYMTNLRDVVVENFREFGLTVDGERIGLHQGLFEHTLRFEPDSQIALAHIDCDWYDPVRLCLERIYARLAVGGCMILDDYNDYRGCRKAADAFLAEKPDLVLVTPRPNALIRRIAAA